MRTAEANMEETSRREYKEDWVKGGGSYRLGEIERGSGSDC